MFAVVEAESFLNKPVPDPKIESRKAA